MSLRFVTIISSLLLFFIASALFTDIHCKGGNNAGLFAASDEEDRPKNVYAVAAAAAARERILRNRKTVVDMVDKVNVMTSKGGKHTSLRRKTLSGNKNHVNFVAFTEDYHKPRHHPPKNN